MDNGGERNEAPVPTPRHARTSVSRSRPERGRARRSSQNPTRRRRACLTFPATRLAGGRLRFVTGWSSAFCSHKKTSCGRGTKCSITVRQDQVKNGPATRKNSTGSVILACINQGSYRTLAVLDVHENISFPISASWQPRYRALSLAPTVRAQSTPATVQSLFEGDRTCGDNPTDCPFPATTASHRFLHIVLHDLPGDINWGVWVGPTCAATDAEAYGALPVRASGYVEAVVDLTTGHPQSWEGTPLCFLFRGGFGRSSTYYAGYFDDTGVADAGSVLPNYTLLGGRRDLADLDVTYIHRDPAYAFDGSPNMPRAGQNRDLYGSCT